MVQSTTKVSCNKCLQQNFHRDFSKKIYILCFLSRRTRFPTLSGKLFVCRCSSISKPILDTSIFLYTVALPGRLLKHPYSFQFVIISRNYRKQIYTLFFLNKNVFFPAQAEYSYSSADFRLKIFLYYCLLYTSPSPRDGLLSRMPSSA